MSSLYRSGLIHGFYATDTTDGHLHAVKPPQADVFLRLDRSTQGSRESFTAAVRSARPHLDAWMAADGFAGSDRVFWVEIKESASAETVGYLCSDIVAPEPRFSVYVQPDNRTHVIHTLDVILRRGDAGSYAVMAPGFQDCWVARHSPEGEAVLLREIVVELVATIMVCCMKEVGLLHLESVAPAPPSFAESRRMKAAPTFLERKRALMAFDIKEVKAYLAPAEPPEPEWQEFDPLAERHSRPHGGYRQHEVKGFVRRMKKSGKIVQVRPFLRGDPSRGVVRPMYVVEP
jgi:hypothetical protein